MDSSPKRSASVNALRERNSRFARLLPATFLGSGFESRDCSLALRLRICRDSERGFPCRDFLDKAHRLSGDSLSATRRPVWYPLDVGSRRAALETILSLHRLNLKIEPHSPGGQGEFIDVRRFG